MTFEDLQKANESIKATRLVNEKTGKDIGDYVEVNQRIKAFRMLYPEGTIETEMLSNENGVCVFKASVYSDGLYYEDKEFRIKKLLGTGTAYEKENSTFINKTSYIENCETSAVGRALAMCGIGIETSVASAEEVQNAVENQEITIDDAKGFVFASGKKKGKTIEEVWYEDADYLQWWLDQGKNEQLKQMITLITGLTPTPIPSVEEQDEKLLLMKEVMDLVDATNSDYEGMLKHFEVESNADMTIEQLKEAKKILEIKLRGNNNG